MEDENAWLMCPLTDRKVTEIVMPELFVADLRREARKDKETTGLLYGFTRDEQLYLVGLLTLGIGKRNNCEFDENYRKFQNEFVRRVLRVKSNLVSVLYHNHPRPNVHEIPEDTLERFNQDLKEGVYDYLKDMGIKPTIERAIEEYTRQLSPVDIGSTFGNAHVLLSDTEREGVDMDHINAYKFIRDAWRGVDRFKVSALSKNKPDTKPFDSTWVVSYCSVLNGIYQELCEEMDLI